MLYPEAVAKSGAFFEIKVELCSTTLTEVYMYFQRGTTEVCRLVVQCNRQMGVDSSNCVLAVSGQPNLIKPLPICPLLWTTNLQTYTERVLLEKWVGQTV